MNDLLVITFQGAVPETVNSIYADKVLELAQQSAYGHHSQHIVALDDLFPTYERQPRLSSQADCLHFY